MWQKYISISAILVATTLLYQLNIIFTVTTKQFTFNFSGPPLRAPVGVDKIFARSAGEC